MAFNANPTAEYPSPLTQYIDYGSRTDGQPVYIGFAKSNLSIASDGWFIQFFSYTTIGSTDFVSSRTSATGSWNNRASLTYA